MHISSIPAFAARLFTVFRCAVSEWIDHRDGSRGAALAFYTLFSMAPILVLVIAMVGLFYGQQAAQGALLAELRALVGTGGADAVQLVLAGARNQQSGRHATIIASALLLFGATSVFAELKASLDEIWQMPPLAAGNWWMVVRTRLVSFGIIIVLAFLLMVSLVISAALALLEHYLGSLWQQALLLLSWLTAALGFCVIGVLFAVIYKMLPRVALSWRDVAIGALGTAAMFTLGKYAIGVYIGNSGVANSYGAAGSIVALLLWVYYSAQIFFLGAEFTRQYALHIGSLRHMAPERTGAPATVRRQGTG